MPALVFTSSARDAEDVVLWRALGHLDGVRFAASGSDLDLSALAGRGWTRADDGPVHVLVGDPAQAAARTPWVVVTSAEHVDGFTPAVVVGASRFHVAADHPELLPALSFPPDRFRRDDTRDDLATARADAIRWRGIALEGWSEAMTQLPEDYHLLLNHAHHLENELAALRGSLSWRVSRPLRAARRLRG